MEDSMLALYTALRNRGNSDRTIYVELRICRSKTGNIHQKFSVAGGSRSAMRKRDQTGARLKSRHTLPLVAWQFGFTPPVSFANII
jgi:hypothetical protein